MSQGPGRRLVGATPRCGRGRPPDAGAGGLPPAGRKNSPLRDSDGPSTTGCSHGSVKPMSGVPSPASDNPSADRWAPTTGRSGGAWRCRALFHNSHGWPPASTNGLGRSSDPRPTGRLEGPLADRDERPGRRGGRRHPDRLATGPAWYRAVKNRIHRPGAGQHRRRPRPARGRPHRQRREHVDHRDLLCRSRARHARDVRSGRVGGVGHDDTVDRRQERVGKVEIAAAHGSTARRGRCCDYRGQAGPR